MTEVYQSIATSNEVEDKYARNDVARKALLGPLSIVIKCLGFDGTYSLFKKETRGRCISWIGTPLLLIAIFVLFVNMFMKIEEVSGFGNLTWNWGETLIVFALAWQSCASAVFLIRRTTSLFFLDYFESWNECARLAEKENKEEKEMKENGDAETGESISSIPRSPNRLFFIILSFLLFTGTTISYSVKYAFYNGHNPMPNQTATSPLLDKFYSLEPLLLLWASIVTATALCVYGILHGILQDTIDDFNKDLKTASNSKTLASRIDSFSVRYQSILIFTRLLSRKMGSFAGFCTIPAVIINFTAMFLSLAFKGGIDGLGYLCFILWTILAISSKFVVLLQPALVQHKLNKTQEILVADREIWKGEKEVAQEAHLMVSKRKYTDTTVSILKCLKLTPWVANGIMVVPPFFGGFFTIIKVFIIDVIHA